MTVYITWLNFKKTAYEPMTVLLIDMGDFWETFQEDAFVVHRCCNVGLTARSIDAYGPVRMCGIPKSYEKQYIAKLAMFGFSVVKRTI